MSLTPGTTLGVYEITAQIGAGGRAKFWKAYDPKLQRDGGDQRVGDTARWRSLIYG